MASDLKIEIFAHNIFHIWRYASDETKAKPNFRKIYGDEYKDDCEEASDELFFIAICFRHSLFDKIHKAEFTDEKVKSLESNLDFYDYVTSTCDREDLFGHLTVFHRMFATLTFVLSFCFRIHQIGMHTVDVVKYGHLFWAMYFDKYTEEFYEKGGWSELKKEAKLYRYLPEFAFHFYKDTCSIQSTKEACANYWYFKNAVDCHERKQKPAIHISYLWIKFRIEHFEKYINIPLSYAFFIDAYQSENLLEDLKILLNPSTHNPDDMETSKVKNQGSSFPTEILYSEIYCGTEEMSANLDDDVKIQHLTFKHESRINGKVSDNFSHISTYNVVESQSRSSTCTGDELILDIIDSNGNQELYKNTSSEVEQLRQTGGLDATRISNTEHNPFPSLEMKKTPGTGVENLTNVTDLSQPCIDNKEVIKIGHLNDGNLEGQDVISNTNQVISIHPIVDTECPKQNSSRDLSNSTFTKGRIYNFNEKYSEEKLKHDVNSNAEKQKEFSKAMDGTSMSYGGASDSDGLFLEPFLKDLKSVNENANSDNERKMIRKAHKDLENEQEDPKVKNFLKLLLILGKGEGTEFLFSVLEGKEETVQKSQENLNKQKKRSKKKKSRK